MKRMISKYFLALIMVNILSCTGNSTGTLIDAACEGNVEKVQILLKEGADVNAKADNGATSLHRASNFGHLDVVEILFANDADVNAIIEGGYTALHFVSIEGHLTLPPQVDPDSILVQGLD